MRYSRCVRSPSCKVHPSNWNVLHVLVTLIVMFAMVVWRRLPSTEAAKPLKRPWLAWPANIPGSPSQMSARAPLSFPELRPLAGSGHLTHKRGCFFSP